MKIIKRLLSFCIGVPTLVFIIAGLPHYNHMAFNMIIVIVSVIGAVEFSNMLKLKSLPVNAVEAAVLGGLCPVMTIVTINLGLGREYIALVLCIGAFWVLVSRVFCTTDKLDSFASRTAAGLAVLIYPGLLMSWCIALADFNESSIVILAFLLITFMNDALAWFTGMLFGKNNRGVIPASPNKSVAGFVGGLLCSVALGVLAARFFPVAFPSVCMPWYIAGGILGLGTGIATVLGDLAESCLKRSSGIKDSGNVIPGRGGMLDCIDSMALAAPVYYLLLRILFTGA